LCKKKKKKKKKRQIDLGLWSERKGKLPVTGVFLLPVSCFVSAINLS